MSDSALRMEFTRSQIEYLNKQYPERVMLPSTTEAEARFYAGQRSVILNLLNRITKERESTDV